MNIASIWPQDRIDLGCFAVLSMDLVAPFLSDLGLEASAMEPLRAAIRLRIDEEKGPLASGGASDADKTEWLEHFQSLMQRTAQGSVVEALHVWLRDTYTSLPADRPNWERYEMFFFGWSVGMRRGDDRAGCFLDPAWVYQAYRSFISSRGLRQRVAEAKLQRLSPWDARIFSLCRYSLLEDEIDSGEYYDPFSPVDSTANRNYFQQYWEYLLPRLTDRERGELGRAVQDHYKSTPPLGEILPPERLTRRAR